MCTYARTSYLVTFSHLFRHPVNIFFSLDSAGATWTAHFAILMHSFWLKIVCVLSWGFTCGMWWSFIDISHATVERNTQCLIEFSCRVRRPISSRACFVFSTKSSTTTGDISCVAPWNSPLSPMTHNNLMTSASNIVTSSPPSCRCARHFRWNYPQQSPFALRSVMFVVVVGVETTVRATL